MVQGRGLQQQELLKETMKYLKMAVESKARERLLILREGSIITQIQEFSGKNNIET